MKNIIEISITRIFRVAALFTVLSIANFAQVDRSKQPAPAAAEKINVGKSKSFTLENGLQVIVVENHKLPLVSLSLVVNNDPVLEKENAGYVDMTGKLLRTATSKKSKDVIDKEVDLIGGELNFTASGFYAGSLKKHSEKLMSIISEVLTDAVFKQEELDKLKKQAKSNIASNKDDPDRIAGKIFKKVIYGENHPYSEDETEQSIDAISLDMCKNYFETYYRPNVSYLSIVGDVSYNEAKVYAEKYFGKWKRGETPKHTYQFPEAPLVNRLVIVDKPNCVQSVIQVGHPVDMRPSAPDFFPARVMNTILGGGIFRLFENLREKHGFTYGAFSSLTSDTRVGSFVAFSSVRNEVTDSALTEIFYEMKRIRTEPVGESELSKAKNYLTGIFAIQLESPQMIANLAINVKRFGLAEDFYQTYLPRLAAVTAAEVQSAAKKYELPEQSFIVIVGKQSDILDKVKKFSVSGRIDFYDVDGNKIDTNASKAPAGVTTDQIIDKYFEAIGGKEKVSALKDVSLSISMSVQGMEITSNVYQKAPDKFLNITSFQGMEQKELFDGEKGGSYSTMGNKVLEGNELQDAKYKYCLNNLLNYKRLGVVLTLKDNKKVGGNDAYQIEAKLSSGTKITYFFDVVSGLKVREDSDVNSPRGMFAQSIEYSDYKEVSGIKYPFTMKTAVAGMSINMTVTKIELNTGIKDSFFAE